MTGPDAGSLFHAFLQEVGRGGFAIFLGYGDPKRWERMRAKEQARVERAEKHGAVTDGYTIHDSDRLVSTWWVLDRTEPTVMLLVQAEIPVQPKGHALTREEVATLLSGEVGAGYRVVPYGEHRGLRVERAV